MLWGWDEAEGCFMAYMVKAKRKIQTKRYAAFRLKYLDAHPYCEAKGCERLAVELDHIIPRSVEPDRDVMDLTNVQALCRYCHEAKTAKENMGSISEAELRWLDFRNDLIKA